MPTHPTCTARRWTLALLSPLGLLHLTGCTLAPTAQTPLEQRVGGLYEGQGRGLTGRVPFRLNLTVQERQGQAVGALINLQVHKAYAVSGTFRPTPEGGELTLNLYENGNRHRGNLYASLRGSTLSGELKTVLLGKELPTYKLELTKVEPGSGTGTAAPPPNP